MASVGENQGGGGPNALRGLKRETRRCRNNSAEDRRAGANSQRQPDFLGIVWAVPLSNSFDRQVILAAIEEAAGVALAPTGLQPVDLRLWIYDDPRRPDWTTESLAVWARRFQLGPVRPA
jgi:hypothetical protein